VRVRVFPATAPAAEILAARPSGVFFSNGPGDPAALPYVVANVRALLDAGLPAFGICLGHQLLALALGARTFKLKFGHRGGNHPVKDLETGRVEITSQNHGFAVEAGSLPPDVVVTHQSLYDGTIEGFRHRERPIFCVQYHPEASPGPHDADYLFGRFVSALANTRG
jgi:carbamoyl-phosphate synthase small subunit